MNRQARATSLAPGIATTGWLAAIGLLAVIARRTGRRWAAAASWQAAMLEACAKGSALYDAMRLAEVPGVAAAEDAGARRTDIQRRGEILTQALYRLREMALDEMAAACVMDVLTSLQALRGAMGVRRVPGRTADARVCDLLQVFDASLRALRASGDMHLQARAWLTTEAARRRIAPQSHRAQLMGRVLRCPEETPARAQRAQ